MVTKEIHDFTGKDQDEKGHHDDDESQCDSVTGAGHSLLNSVLLSHSVRSSQGSDQRTITDTEDCHGNQDSQDCLCPDEGSVPEYSPGQSILCLSNTQPLSPDPDPLSGT